MIRAGDADEANCFQCPPVAAAIAREKRDGVSHTHCSRISFPVVDVADSMGWDSGPVKKELKMLQWTLDQRMLRLVLPFCLTFGNLELKGFENFRSNPGRMFCLIHQPI